MAVRLGLHRNYLADVERGKRNMPIVNLEVRVWVFAFEVVD